MKDIAAAVGISRNSLYRYFQDKTDLGLAIIEIIFSQQLRQIAVTLDEVLRQVETPARKRLEVLLIDWLAGGLHSQDEKFVAEFDAYFSGGRITEVFQTRMQQLLPEKTLTQLQTLVEQGQIDGSIRVDIPAELLFPTLVNGIRALQQRVILRRDALVESSAANAEKMPFVLLTLLIDGITPR